MKHTRLPLILGVLLGITTLSTGWLYHLLTTAEERRVAQEAELLRTIDEHTKVHEADLARISALEGQLTETEATLTLTIDEREELSDDLRAEKGRNEEFEEQIEDIGKTVGTLDKLAKTDPELLMKYSKVYFLNEHYMPVKLVEIEKTYLYDESTPKFIHAQVAPQLGEMIDDALDDGVKIWVKSAFRSFDEQASLKGAYSVAYGSGANTFSADQGYSEHQLGTTVDLTTEGLSGGLTNFETTAAYTWLVENAYKYGFVLSYPLENAYYIFEPWHWRFVGEDLARDLHKDGKYFYDLDQRDIDAYLISIFD